MKVWLLDSHNERPLEYSLEIRSTKTSNALVLHHQTSSSNARNSSTSSKNGPLMDKVIDAETKDAQAHSKRSFIERLFCCCCYPSHSQSKVPRITPEELNLDDIFAVSYATTLSPKITTKNWSRALSANVSKTPTPFLKIHSFKVKNVEESWIKPDYVSVIIKFDSVDMAAQTREQILDIIRRNLCTSHSSPKEVKFFFLVNPFSGTRRAPKIFKKYVKPLLDVAEIDYTFMETDTAGHAYDIAKNHDFTAYTRIFCISGDGLFHEFLNGYLTRPEHRTFPPVGLISGGTSNAFSKNMDAYHPILGTISAITGVVTDMDVMAISSLNPSNNQVETKYAFLSVTWAIIADIDIESEKIRWAGSTRYDIWSVVRILNKRKYHGKVFFIPSSSSSTSSPSDGKDTVPVDHKLALTQPLEELQKNGWTLSDEEDYLYFMATSLEFISKEFLAAKGARLNDGAIHLITIPGKASSIKFLSSLLNQSSGQYLESSSTTHRRVSAFILNPLPSNGSGEGGRGIVDIDGEEMRNERIIGEIRKGEVRVVVPRWSCNSGESRLTKDNREE